MYLNRLKNTYLKCKMKINKMMNRVPPQIRRRKLLTFLSILMFSVLIILQTDLSPDLYFIHWGPLENISCHYIKEMDVLPSADDGEYMPPPQSIFFHETSCRGRLDSRQACAVESAARAHPEWQINVLFAAPVTKFTLNNGNLKILQEFDNVKLARIHVADYAKGTPLEGMVAGGALNRTRWRISHTSDILRYLTLYKWGGVYLDLDVVVARPLGSLARNWAARESDLAVAAGVLAFSRDQVGRSIAEACIRNIKKKYRGDVWGHNGPGVITRVLKEFCTTTEAYAMSAVTCQGFEVYGPQFFYPIEWQHANLYFEPGELEVQNAYIYHVWNQVTQNYPIHRKSPYAKLAQRFCPSIYKEYGTDFGS